MPVWGACAGVGAPIGDREGRIFVSVQRLDVELSLKITPRINAANFVTLEQGYSTVPVPDGALEPFFAEPAERVG